MTLARFQGCRWLIIWPRGRLVSAWAALRACGADPRLSRRSDYRSKHARRRRQPRPQLTGRELNARQRRKHGLLKSARTAPVTRDLCAEVIGGRDLGAERDARWAQRAAQKEFSESRGR